MIPVSLSQERESPRRQPPKRRTQEDASWRIRRAPAAGSTDQATQIVMNDSRAQKVLAEAKSESAKPRPSAAPADDAEGSEFDNSYYSEVAEAESAVDDEMRPVPTPSAGERSTCSRNTGWSSYNVLPKLQRPSMRRRHGEVQSVCSRDEGSSTGRPRPASHEQAEPVVGRREGDRKCMR